MGGDGAFLSKLGGAVHALRLSTRALPRWAQHRGACSRRRQLGERACSFMAAPAAHAAAQGSSHGEESLTLRELMVRAIQFATQGKVVAWSGIFSQISRM